jgi:hypothetical protein
MKNTKTNIFTTLRYSINHKHSSNNFNFTQSNQHQKTTLTKAPNIYIYPQNRASTKIILTRQTFNQFQPNIYYQTDITQIPKQLITTNKPWTVKITTVTFNKLQGPPGLLPTGSCYWVGWGLRSLNAAFPCWSCLSYFNK